MSQKCPRNALPAAAQALPADELVIARESDRKSRPRIRGASAFARAYEAAHRRRLGIEWAGSVGSRRTLLRAIRGRGQPRISRRRSSVWTALPMAASSPRSASRALPVPDPAVSLELILTAGPIKREVRFRTRVTALATGSPRTDRRYGRGGFLGFGVFGFFGGGGGCWAFSSSISVLSRAISRAVHQILARPEP